mgnify:CR=1 FL=1
MTADGKIHLSRSHLRELLSAMIRIRKFEETCAELYTREKIRGFLHLYDGEEAVAVGVIPCLRPEDRIVAKAHMLMEAGGLSRQAAAAIVDATLALPGGGALADLSTALQTATSSLQEERP